MQIITVTGKTNCPVCQKKVCMIALPPPFSAHTSVC